MGLIHLPPKRHLVKPRPWGAHRQEADAPGLWRGLRVSLPFWEGGGSEPRDIVAGAEGTAGEAVSWTVAQGGPALAFDGSGTPIQGLLVGGNGIVAFMENTFRFTADFILTPDDLSGLRAIAGQSLRNTEKGVSFFTTSTGAVRVWVADGTSIVYDQTTPSGVLTVGQRHHIIIRANGTSATVFVDGVAHALGGAISSSHTGDSFGPLEIGAGSGGETPFLGTIERANYWDRELSNVEVAALTSDPWAPFRRRRTLYIGTAGSGVSGGSSAPVAVTPAGAGTKAVSGGSSASVAGTAAGAGTKAVSGGSSASVGVTAAGAGTKAAQAGSASSVAVTPAGAGTKAAQAGSSASVAVTAVGGGTATQEEAASGGSNAPVAVTAAAGGTKNARSPPANAPVAVTTAGAGTKVASGGSTSPAAVTPAGVGTKAVSGGSSASVAVTAVGAGEASASDVEGGSSAAVGVTAAGAGTKAVSGGSAASVAVTAVGGGSPLFSGSGSWAFVLDGHVFYVLSDVDGSTYVCDMTTGQWHHWYTGIMPQKWNMFRGLVWKGRVLACGSIGNTIWEVAPESMLDEGTRQIQRVVTAFQALRGRGSVRQGSFRVTASVGEPTADPATVQLRFSDDEGETWSVTHSRILSVDAFGQVIRFRSLGRIRAPGRIWEVSDIGGLVRIEGVDSDMEGE